MRLAGKRRKLAAMTEVGAMVSAMGGYDHVVAVWLTIPLPSYPLLRVHGKQVHESCDAQAASGCALSLLHDL